MGGFEDIILPCVGKGIEPSILFLVELAGIQSHHPDFNSSTEQSSLLFRVRDAAMFATMEPDDQAKVLEEEGKFEVSKRNVCALPSSGSGCCPECPELTMALGK